MEIYIWEIVKPRMYLWVEKVESPEDAIKAINTFQLNDDLNAKVRYNDTKFRFSLTFKGPKIKFYTLLIMLGYRLSSIATNIVTFYSKKDKKRVLITKELIKHLQ